MVNSKIQEAYACFQKRDYISAENLLKKIIDENPDLPEPRAHLANLLYFHKRYVEAAEFLEPIQNIPGMKVEHDWAQFNASWISGDFNHAAEIAKHLLTNGDLTSERYQQLLIFSRQSGNFSLAFKIAKRNDATSDLQEIKWLQKIVSILNIFPLFFRRLFVKKIAANLNALCRWRRLHLLYEAAHIADPKNAEWPYNIGQLERQIRDVYNPEYTREQAWYEVALKVDPHHQLAYFFLCRTLFDMGCWHDLIAQINECDHSIWQQEFQKMKAAALFNLEQIDQAEQLYSKCLKQWNLPFYVFCLGLIAFQKQEYQKAKELLDDAYADSSLIPLCQFYQKIIETIQSGGIFESLDGQLLLDDIIAENKDVLEDEQEMINEDTCCLCGYSAPRKFLWKDRTTGWKRVRCPQCKMISVSPMPSEDEITALYVNETRSEHTLQKRYKNEVEGLVNVSEDHCRNLPLYRDITEWPSLEWNFIENDLPNKTFLDVGCSAGRAVLVMQKCGWAAEGIDLDADAIQFGQSLGLDLYTVTIADCPENKQYSLITLLDVIEHVADPIELLKECHKRLLSGGILLVKTPCAESLPHYFVGDRWLESSEHLQFFSRKTLTEAIQKTGYQILSLKQQQQAPTHFLHDQQWQGRFFPEWLIMSMDQLAVGDTISVLAQKA